jgi:predicted CoA-binding protein
LFPGSQPGIFINKIVKGNPMASMQEVTKEFLALKCIAVVGVSRTQNKAANLIYRKLRSEGYKVFAVNPNAATVEGDISYPNLKAVPNKPDGVVIVTKPEITNQVVQECAELGISRIWMHKGVDSKTTSVSANAVNFCREHDITVIPGGCPMMYISNADIGHRFMRWIQNLNGSLPKQV